MAFWNRRKPPPLMRKVKPTYTYEIEGWRFRVTLRWPKGSTKTKSFPNMAAGFAWIKHYEAIPAGDST